MYGQREKRLKTQAATTNKVQPDTTLPWAPGSLAPSLAITSDWWNQSARLEPLSEELFQNPSDGPATAAPVLPQPGAESGAHPHCPACGSIIYSRRHRLCGVCAHPLPSEVLFSEAESSRIELVVEMERERHREWRARGSA